MKAVTSVFKNFAQKECNKSLEAIIKEIKEGKYKTLITKLRKHLENDEKDKASKLKSNLPAFTPSGTFDDGRKARKITSYSGYIILDIDKLSKSQLQKTINTTRLAPYTYASFISPSGNGLKILVAVNSKKEDHKEAYNQVREYYETALNIDIDTSGSDVSRLCFMSFDPDCYINFDADIFEVEIKKEVVQQSIIQPKINVGNDDIEAYILLIEQSGTDITGNYETWRNLGFAISGEYGETGRNYFHRISKFYVGYNYKECDQQFSKCLSAKGSGVNISTFYYLAHSENIKPYKEPIIEEVLPIKDKLLKEDYTGSPTFSTSLIPQLPQLLQDMVKHSKSDQEKDLMILGSITTISACLPNLYGIYDGDKIYPNLYLFVSAPAASGKGKIKFCKRLVNRIHDNMQEEAILMKDEYDTQLAQYNKNKGKDTSIKKPKKPPLKMLYMPANNSSSGMFQLLFENKGKGLIFETEADTLAKNFTKDYGDYSDGFRNAFHHEPITYYRKTEREYVEMKEPCLSCVLTGTPKQVLSLIPNAENGLFSRFMFYQMPSSTKWRNVFAISSKNGLNEYYDVLGKQFYELHRSLKTNSPIKFSYTEKQQEDFLNFFQKINLYYLNINPIDYDASVKRLGVIAFRISMILTALRILETGDISNPLYCSDEDFQSTLTIVKVLIKHSSKVYSSLPDDKTTIDYKNKKEQFIEHLPLRFTTQDFQNYAGKLSITSKTAERYITNLCKTKFLARESQGNYYNPSKEEDKGSEEIKGTK